MEPNPHYQLSDWLNSDNLMSKLYVDSVMKNYGQRQILTDIYLECSQGEIIGLLGRNGSGKSTLLEIIFGSKKADSRFIKIDGKLIKKLSGNLIKYLPQNSFLPNNLKVSKIIPAFADNENTEIIKENIFIKPMLNKKCGELSGGEKRLLEIYLIICSNAKFVLIDEPFNGIAPIYKESIKSLMKEHSKNKGFIVTDHDYNNILDVATRVVLLHDGGTKEIIKKEDLKFWGYIPESLF